MTVKKDTNRYEKKISIVIPVYNVEKYLEECLQSVLQQNFNDYEIICVDDASTDNSGNILNDYEKRYDIIHVFRHTQNRGLSVARNTGLEHAVGKYIWFVDSDDMICSGSLTELYDMAEENQTDLICFKWSYDEEDRNLHVCFGQGANKIYSGRELFCILAKEEKIVESACVKFIAKSFLEKSGIYFYEGILHEDVLFTFFCMMQAERVINIEKVYYKCNRRETSITAQKNHKSAESNFIIMLQLITYWYTHSFTKEENAALKAYVYTRYINYQYCDRFGERAQNLDVGSPVDKALYDLFYNMKKDKKVVLNETQLRQIKNMKNVIVFGASCYAADIVDILKENGIKIKAMAVSDMAFNPTLFCGVPVETLENISNDIKDDVIIVMGVSIKTCIDMKPRLESLGYHNIIIPEYKV